MNPTSLRSAGQDIAKREAFAAIARLNEAGLIRTAKRLCQGDLDLALDLVQDTFVSAYRAFLDDRFDGRHPKAWLTRILTNSFLLSKRQNRSDSGLEVETIANHDSASGVWNSQIPSPDQCLLEGTFSEPLERALMSLPDSQRLCVLLADVEQLPYTEVAATLGIPIGTVRSRLARARMQMLTVIRDLQRLEVQS